MTALLEKAIAAAKKSPPEIQDAIASLILAELQDEEIWRQAFEKTRDEQWDRIAEKVRAEIAAGDFDICRSRQGREFERPVRSRI